MGMITREQAIKELAGCYQAAAHCVEENYSRIRTSRDGYIDELAALDDMASDLAVYGARIRELESFLAVAS